MHKVILIFVCIKLFCSAFSKDLPPDFQKCKRSDADRNQCLTVAFQKALPLLENGLPSFKMPALDPLRIESMVIGAGSGPVQVVQNFKDVDIYNLTKLTVTETKENLTDTELILEFDLENEQITLKAKYELNGKILVLPVVGKGPCILQLRDIKIRLTFIGEPVEKNGKTYMKIKIVKVSLNPKMVNYNFVNLFNGDKQLGDAINKILNENDLLVFSDVQSGYEEFFSVVFKELANKIFEHVPYKDIFPL